MKKTDSSFLFLILLLLSSLALTGCGHSPLADSNAQSPSTQSTSPYPLTIQNYDQQENMVSYTYQKTPERVIITHPGATELLLELGLQDKIVATVTPYGPPLDRLASQYKALPTLKAPYTPSQEELLEMQPHMIRGWAHQFTPHEIGEVATWNLRGVATFIMPSTLTKATPTLERVVYSSISGIGKIFNIQSKADGYIQNMKERVTGVQTAVKDVEKKKTVMVLQDHSNGTFSLYDTHYLISHMIEIAGGINICETPASFVGAEKVLSFDPDVIILVTSNFTDPTKDMTDEEAIRNLKAIKELQNLRAIRQGNIINLPFFTVNNGGIRTVDAIEKIASSLYPERLKQAEIKAQ